MQYWTEKCPYCGAKARQNSISNNKDFGSPLVMCNSCGKYYVHPDKMEIGMLSDRELQSFEGKMMFSFSWRLLFLAFAVVIVLSEITHLLSLGMSALVAGLIFVIIHVRLRGNTKRLLQDELTASRERLSQPGYKEMLQQCGYKPRWNP